MPHFEALASMYLIILISAWPKLAISLQASSGGALRSLAALISLPRFSASSRSGRKPFMQASVGPALGPCGPPPPPKGAAPCAGNALGAAATGAPPAGGNGEDCAGAPPPTGGNGEALAGWFGSGAGNAPCAPTSAAWRVTTAIASGAIRRRMIKGKSPARSKAKIRGAPTSSDRSDSECEQFYDPGRVLTTHGMGQQRGMKPQYLPRNLIL